MAPGFMANEEQLHRHKINGSGVASKYVGGTVKRLNEILHKAWPSNLILCFEEADGLLGRRYTVKDVRDR